MPFQPDYAVSPGETILDIIRSMHITKLEAAEMADLEPKEFLSIVDGKTPITPYSALKLERGLRMPVQFWLNLETNYQSTCTRLALERVR